jgi:hypothetical protein
MRGNMGTFDSVATSAASSEILSENHKSAISKKYGRYIKTRVTFNNVGVENI